MGENMKDMLAIFVILNLVIYPIGIAIAEEQNSIQINVLTYKIGDKYVETSPLMGQDQNIKIAAIESKATEDLKGQPLLKIKSELSSNKQERKIILKIDLENIGEVKAKNIEAKSNPEKGAKALYIKGGTISNDTAIWKGEIEPKEYKELTYELNYNGDNNEDLKIPLTITGSGSDDWIIDLVIVIFKWWLAYEFGIDIPVTQSPGFGVILGLSMLTSASILINKYRKNYENK